MLGSGSEYEPHRLRAGLMVLALGLAVLLAAVGMAILRSPAPTGEVGATEAGAGAAGHDGLPIASAESIIPVLAVLAIALVATLLVVAYALFRLTRRLALPATSSRRKVATPTDDVWKMHQVPALPPDDDAADTDAQEID